MIYLCRTEVYSTRVEINIKVAKLIIDFLKEIFVNEKEIYSDVVTNLGIEMNLSLCWAKSCE